MPYQGCPGWGACLTTQALTSRSQLQQCELCKKLPLKAPQAPWRHTAVICTTRTQCRTVSRSPAWPRKTGFRPSRWIQPWVWSWLDCGMEPWVDNSPNRPTLLNFITPHMSETTSDYEKVSYTGEPRPRESEETLFQLVLPGVHREVTLRGWHNEVGHSRPGVHARPCVWPVLVALHGCSGKGMYWQVLSMPNFQGQTAQEPTGKNCGHTSLRAHPPWLSVLGTGERSRGECSSGNRPPSLSMPKPKLPNPRLPRQLPNPYGKSSLSTMGCLKRSSQIRVGIWESAGGWSL